MLHLFFSMTIEKKCQTGAWRQSSRGVLIRKRQAETDAHVHSSDSNKEPLVGSTCLRKTPVCSWLGGSAAKSPPQLLCVPSHFVTCACFLLPETIWEGLSVCNECALRALGQDLDRVGGSSFSHWILQLKFHNTANSHRAIHWANEPAALPSCCPGQLRRPAPAASSLKSNVCHWLLEKLSRDLILPLQVESCMQPATCKKPIELHYSPISNPTVTSDNKYNLISDHCNVS